MRGAVLSIVFAAFTLVCSAQQSVIVVDSEKIFKSQSDYVAALATIDAESKAKQSEIDARFAEVERLFNEYAQTRATITTQAAQQIETFILNREKEATALQESYFSQSGEVVKRRMELISPIQKRVFAAIDDYAKSIGADIVFDKAANSSLLYNSAAADHTEQIINKIK